MKSEDMDNAVQGILPASAISAYCDGGQIRLAHPPAADQIQPASLDLRLGEVAYRVRASFLPGKRFTVAERLKELELHRVPLTSGAAAKSALLVLAQGLPPGRAAAFEWMLIVGAVATALLMVRLLRCLAPGQGDGCSALLWLPAVALLVASTMFGVLVQRQLGTADSGPEKWLVAWLPVLLAVGLEALTRRSGWRMPRIPAGDLVNVVEGLARRMARESAAGREAEAGHTDGKPPARSTAWLERVVALPPRWESLLVSDYAGPWLTFAVAIGLAVVIAIG